MTAGSIFRNFNTDPLFADYVPAQYYVRNPDLTRTSGLYENLVDQAKSAVWPVRPTLGVNRGYRPEVPRPDGSAYYYQGVSSPMIYRGNALPKEFYGQAFVVDSPTNLVHLVKLKRRRRRQSCRRAIIGPRASSWLRPTNASAPPGWCPAPDGSFLIVDMYRGVSARTSRSRAIT